MDAYFKKLFWAEFVITLQPLHVSVKPEAIVACFRRAIEWIEDVLEWKTRKTHNSSIMNLIMDQTNGRVSENTGENVWAHQVILTLNMIVH